MKCVKFISLFVLLYSNSCNSQKEKDIVTVVYQGNEQLKKVETFYENGKPESTFFIDDKGKLHGTYISWHENGNMSAKWEFYHGERNGTQLSWWENGQLSSHEEYLSGKKNGEYIIFDAGGKKVIKYELYQYDSLVYSRKIIDSFNAQQTFQSLIKGGIDSLKAEKIIDTLYYKSK